MNSVFEALAHPTRREILEMLKGGSKTAGDIADAFHVSKPTMSGHFAKLKEAGLIQADQRGTTILYSLNLSTLEEVLLGFMGRMGTEKNGKEKGQ
jgi:DNA-binding transcriptional ArsR family regulator